MVISNMPKLFQIVPRAISDQIYADNFMKIHSPVFVVMLLQGAILDKIPVSMGYNIHVASPPPKFRYHVRPFLNISRKSVH